MLFRSAGSAGRASLSIGSSLRGTRSSGLCSLEPGVSRGYEFVVVFGLVVYPEEEAAVRDTEQQLEEGFLLLVAVGTSEGALLVEQPHVLQASGEVSERVLELLVSEGEVAQLEENVSEVQVLVLRLPVLLLEVDGLDVLECELSAVGRDESVEELLHQREPVSLDVGQVRHELVHVELGSLHLRHSRVPLSTREMPMRSPADTRAPCL